MAAEGEFPKADGDILFASEVNHFNGKIQQIYIGTGFNSSQAGTGTDEQSFELDAVTTTFDSNNVVITITGLSDRTAGTIGNVSFVNLKAQIKETGGAYADILAYALVFEAGSIGAPVSFTTTYRIVATLTAGMKTNGFQIKVFSKSQSGTSTTTTFTNKQTIQELA